MSNTRKTRRDAASVKELEDQQMDASNRDDFNDFNRRFNKIEDLIADLKDSLHAKYDEIDNRLNEVKKSQKFISDQYDNFCKVVDTLTIDNRKLRDENAQLKASINALQNDVFEAHEAINNLEQYGRRSMLEISGVPKCADEIVEEIVMNIGSKIGVELEHQQIEAAHRISSRETANIIVMFNSRKLRNEFFQSRSNLKGVTSHDIGITTRTASKIFINESLTRKNKELFNKVLNFRRERGYNYIWTRNGNIYLKQSDYAKSIIIKHEIDLLKLGKINRVTVNSREEDDSNTSGQQMGTSTQNNQSSQEV